MHLQWPYFQFLFIGYKECFNISFVANNYMNALFYILNFMLYIKQCHSSPLFKKTNNLNIFQIIEYYASIFMFQKLNSTVSNVFQQNKFMFYSYHTYETRNNISIRTPLFNLQISENSIFDHSIKIWNYLSPEIKCTANKNKFTKIIRKKLINEK